MVQLLLMHTEELQKDGAWAAAVAQCSPQRRGKLEQLREPAPRLRSLAGTVLLDRALRAAGYREQNAEYAILPGGKPWIPALPDFHFSLSHSGNLALCAISDRPVGADVQCPRRFSERLMMRYFTERERSCAEPLRLWTLKESYGKHTGEGVAVLQRTELLFGDSVRILDGGVQQNVTFREFRLRDGTRIAVCTSGTETEFGEPVWQYL